jgi:ACS family D-galactonate transporter-like MFS transporter
MQRWVIVGLLFFGILVSYIDRGNLGIAAPHLMRDFALSPAYMGTLLSSFFWTYGLCQLPMGYLVDRFGIRRTYAFAFMLWSLASAGVGFAQTPGQILSLRLLLGVAEAAGPLASMAFIKRNFEEKQQGLPTAIYLAGQMAGPALGTVVGGMLLEWYGWRALFIITGLVGFVWLPLWWLFGPRDDVKPKTVADPAPAAAASGGLKAVFSDSVFWAMTVASFLYSYFWYFVLTWVPSYLVNARGMSDAKMGLTLGGPLAWMAVVSLTAGAASDALIRRTGNTLLIRKIFLGTGFVIGSSILMLMTVGDRSAVTRVFVLSLTGIGLAGGNFWALAQMTGPPQAIGRVIGFLNTVAQLAGACAPLLTGFLLSILKNYDAALVVAGLCPVLTALTLVFFVTRRGLDRLHAELGR